MSRAAASQANQLQGQDASTAAQNNANANSTYSTLNPFLQNELAHPQGFSQQDQTAQLAAAQAGSGGTNSAINGAASLQAARTRNASGFAGSLDQAARIRGQQNAQASEQVASNDAQLKQTQQQAGAAGLQGLFNSDSSNALRALGLQDQTIGTEAQASPGWLQNTLGAINAVSGAGKSAAGLGLKF